MLQKIDKHGYGWTTSHLSRHLRKWLMERGTASPDVLVSSRSLSSSVLAALTTPTTNLSDITAGTGGFALNGEATYDVSGVAVSNAGDVNGDGLDDLIIGARGGDLSGERTNAGKSYLVFGKTDGTAINLSQVAAGIGGFALNGEFLESYSGNSVSGAGDVNGDGLADLIIGSRGISVGGQSI